MERKKRFIMFFQRIFKLTPIAYKHKKLILEGIINEVKNECGLLSKKEKSEVVKRRLICEDCEFNSKNMIKKDPVRLDDFCSLCDCNIKLKTACLRCNCGLENLEGFELKWKQIE